MDEETYLWSDGSSLNLRVKKHNCTHLGMTEEQFQACVAKKGRVKVNLRRDNNKRNQPFNSFFLPDGWEIGLTQESGSE